MKLTVNLVTYNGAKYLPFLFKSLKNQIYKDWILNVLDNNSDDETVESIKKELDTLDVQYTFQSNKKNNGFSGGHNQLYRETKTEYILILNQDTYLQENCLGMLTEYLDKNQDVAVVSPRLMKWDFAKQENGFTEMIDSMGLKLWRNKRVTEIAVGENYDNYGEYKERVFGVSATCILLRKSMVDNVLLENGEVFDSSYFMYKEDVDLSYRMQQRGYGVAVLRDVVVFHDRSGKSGKDISDLQSAKNKKTQNDLIQYYSYKNHLATIYKNICWQNFVIDFPYIVWYEFRKFVYFLLFNRKVLKGIGELYKQKNTLKIRRQYIQNNRKKSWQELRVGN